MTTTHSKNLEAAIRDILRRPGNEYRTAGGLSREFDVSVDDVRRVIESRPDMFGRAPVSLGGIPGYCLREEASAASSERFGYMLA